jgi:hypothetical protein
VIGGLTGGVYGVAEQYMEGLKQNRKEADEFSKELKRQGEGGAAPEKTAPKAMLAPISLSLNVDGATLARVMSSISANSFSGQAPAYDGLESWVGGDHNYPDK